MIITISGSFRFKDEMIEVYNFLTEKGHLVWLPYLPEKSATCSTPHDCHAFCVHCEKIRRSDTLYVVYGENHYIGESTRMEIKYAEKIGVPVYFVTGVMKEQCKL